MMFMLVYYAEHYVIDELAGVALVALVMAGWALWERRRPVAASRTRAPSSELETAS